ncbi:uncharacterized protein LOC117588392 [Drosophila guanche]|uniref:Uncharacterized protein n=1 Tax=Drosophila guanche TaxID=7266 RepID=A0A3B0KJV9_DROGU|nr:uncharacterized protein LOC117588392 [Drosophila guanche]SPP86779.1 Hypothetical predicted protein [Drosophila guanche]
MSTKTLKLGFFNKFHKFFGSKCIRNLHKAAVKPVRPNPEPCSNDGPLQRVLRQIQTIPRPSYLGFHPARDSKSEEIPKLRAASRHTASATTLGGRPRRDMSQTMLSSFKKTLSASRGVAAKERSKRQRESSTSSIAMQSSPSRRVGTSLNAADLQDTRDKLMKMLRRKEQRQSAPIDTTVSAIRINSPENAGSRSYRRIRVHSSWPQLNVDRCQSNVKLIGSNSRPSVKVSRSVRPPKPAKRVQKDLASGSGADVKSADSRFERFENKNLKLDNNRKQLTARKPAKMSASGSVYPPKKVSSSGKRTESINLRAPKNSRSISLYAKRNDSSAPGIQLPEDEQAFDLAELMEIESQLMSTLATFTEGSQELDMSEFSDIKSLLQPDAVLPKFDKEFDLAECLEMESKTKVASVVATQTPIEIINETPLPAIEESQTQESPTANSNAETENNKPKYFVTYCSRLPGNAFKLFDAAERSPKRIWSKVAENEKEDNKPSYTMKVQSKPLLPVEDNDESED